MRLLLLEYVTAGGLGRAAGQSLCAEADAMACALARDFGALPGVRLSLPRCESLPWPSGLPGTVRRAPGLAQVRFAELLQDHDAVLLLAPETGDILHALTVEVESRGLPLLGASASAVADCGDKWRCFLKLAAAGIPQVPSCPAAGPWPDFPGAWVLKPVDGCGSEGVQRFPDAAAARAALARRQAEGQDLAGWLAQPWWPGQAASLSVLSTASGVRLLSVNRQRLVLADDGAVHLQQVDTGHFRDEDGHLARLAARVAEAVPGLRGVWGIDILLADGQCHVVEVNPRVTSAYPALAEVLDDNPARLWLEGGSLAQPTAARAAVLGWDLGGAHLKVAALDAQGRLLEVIQRPCALWQGLDRLEPLLAELCSRWGVPDCHALTMSGEMVDLFPDRATGVAALLDCMQRHAGAVPVRVYAGGQWLQGADCSGRAGDIASANWLAMGDWAARHAPAGVVLDVGSTTCDALSFHDGRAQPAALGDFARLASGELVYTGVTRTPLMALAQTVELDGQRRGVMAEWFASSADVYRVLGELPEDCDLHPSADGGPKTMAGSVRRLARMVGCDGPEFPLAVWQSLARQFRAVQLAQVRQALTRAVARLPAGPAARPERPATVVVAGSGAFLARAACAELAVTPISFGALGGIAPSEHLATLAERCAPAVAVAALCHAERRARRDSATAD